jgi:hypothetical protein
MHSETSHYYVLIHPHGFRMGLPFGAMHCHHLKPPFAYPYGPQSTLNPNRTDKHALNQLNTNATTHVHPNHKRRYMSQFTHLSPPVFPALIAGIVRTINDGQPRPRSLPYLLQPCTNEGDVLMKRTSVSCT